MIQPPPIQSQLGTICASPKRKKMKQNALKAISTPSSPHNSFPKQRMSCFESLLKKLSHAIVKKRSAKQSKYFLCQFFTLQYLMSSSLRMFQLPEAITRRGDPSKGSKPIVRGGPGGCQDDCARTQESGNSDFTETRLMNRQKELDWALSIISHSLVCTPVYTHPVYGPCI